MPYSMPWLWIFGAGVPDLPLSSSIYPLQWSWTFCPCRPSCLERMHYCVIFSARSTSVPLLYSRELPPRNQPWMTQEKHSSSDSSYFLPGQRPSLPVLLVMILLAVSSQSCPLSSENFFTWIGDDGFLALGCQLGSSYGGGVLTETSFYCDTFFALIRDDAVMLRG